VPITAIEPDPNSCVYVAFYNGSECGFLQPPVRVLQRRQN
jgi:hypothetical protein